MKDPYRSCSLCPRYCAADRYKTPGFCKSGTELVLSSAVLHKGEEPPIAGTNGSGTLFFCGCTLGCRYCQNHQISRSQAGRVISQQEFTGLLLELQERGAHNINFVTGTHFIPGIIRGLKAARKKGLHIPAVWNTSGFESDTGLDLLDGHIDIYLPDFKCADRKTALRLLSAPMYVDGIEHALQRMLKPADYDEQGIMQSGTIIRHLVLPGELENTRNVLKIYSEKYMDKALLSVMVQYLPPDDEQLCADLPERMKPGGRGLSEEEYGIILGWLEEFGIEYGFIQDLEQDSGWLPDFNKNNPFPDDYSQVVWHWES